MSKFLVNFIMDQEIPQVCWVVSEDNPTQIIEAAWAEEDTFFGPGCNIQPFSHPDISEALGFFWQAVQEYRLTHLDNKQIQSLERLLFV